MLFGDFSDFVQKAIKFYTKKLRAFASKVNVSFLFIAGLQAKKIKKEKKKKKGRDKIEQTSEDKTVSYVD